MLPQKAFGITAIRSVTRNPNNKHCAPSRTLELHLYIGTDVALKWDRLSDLLGARATGKRGAFFGFQDHPLTPCKEVQSRAAPAETEVPGYSIQHYLGCCVNGEIRSDSQTVLFLRGGTIHQGVSKTARVHSFISAIYLSFLCFMQIGPRF